MLVLPETVKIGRAGDFLTYVAYVNNEAVTQRVTLGEDGVVAIKWAHECGEYAGHCRDRVEDWVTEDTYWETVQTLANAGGSWLVLGSALRTENVQRIIREQELWNDCFG